jgi:hypothetical protein
LVMVGAKLRRKMEVVLCNDFGFSGLSSSTVSICSFTSSFCLSFSASSSSSFFSFLSFSSSLSLLLLDEPLLLPEKDRFLFLSAQTSS